MGVLRNLRVMRSRSSVFKFVLGGSVLLAVQPVAVCAGAEKGSAASSEGSVAVSGGPSSPNGDKPDPVMAMIDQYMPELQKLGFGGLMGICTGVATKRLGNNVAGIIGAGFIVLQGLSYMGYIKIDFGKISTDAQTLVDSDGDGKITANDLKMIWAKVLHFLTFNLPGAGGFSAGFVMGVYFGN